VPPLARGRSTRVPVRELRPSVLAFCLDLPLEAGLFGFAFIYAYCNRNSSAATDLCRLRHQTVTATGALRGCPVSPTGRLPKSLKSARRSSSRLIVGRSALVAFPRPIAPIEMRTYWKVPLENQLDTLSNGMAALRRDEVLLQEGPADESSMKASVTEEPPAPKRNRMRHEGG